LNSASTDGKITLPNNHCIIGDLIKPSLLEKGEDFVRKIVKEIEDNNTTFNHRAHEYEPNRIETLLYLDEEVSRTNWKPTIGVLSPVEAQQFITEAFEELKTINFKEVTAILEK